MDLRIVNTCNNNCLYCLEQDYRNREKYIDKNIIFKNILNSKNKEILNFYGWNPLLHPDLLEIIKFAKNNSFKNISLLTNTFWTEKKYLNELKKAWLNQIWIYFNWVKNHKIVSNSTLELYDLIKNIELINSLKIKIKFIIHINKQNIFEIYKNILFLSKNFMVFEFEFINYFPFDRPYEKYKNLLEYDVLENRKNIDKMFLVIKKLSIKARFVKFPKDFFWEYLEFYDFENGILNQIWEEDILRLKEKKPFCLIQKRCKNCFIKDNCKFYGEKI